MNGGVASKLCLIVFLASILFLWDAKSTLAGSVPTKTGKKESVQKQTEQEKCLKEGELRGMTTCAKENSSYTDDQGVKHVPCCDGLKCGAMPICIDKDAPECTSDHDCPRDAKFCHKGLCKANDTEGAGDVNADLSEPHKNSGLKSRTPDCSNWPCFAIRRPVCGSDGTTYPNKCVLKQTAACKDGKQDLVIASEGKCSGGRSVAAGHSKQDCVRRHKVCCYAKIDRCPPSQRKDCSKPLCTKLACNGKKCGDVCKVSIGSLSPGKCNSRGYCSRKTKNLKCAKCRVDSDCPLRKACIAGMCVWPY